MNQNKPIDGGAPAPASTRRKILETALSHVTKDRQATHGKPEKSFEHIGRLWTAYLQNKFGSTCNVAITLDATDVALMMSLMKVARATHNPLHADNWIDLAGYAACGADVAASSINAF